MAIAKREEISMVFDFRDQLRRAALWSIDLADFTLRQTAPLMLVSYEKALLKPERFVDELAQFSGVDASEAMRRAASIVVKPSPADYVKGSQVRLSQDAISDVAVILPFYNGSKYIRRAVESVQRQSLAPAEFVVVNDGSKPRKQSSFMRLPRSWVLGSSIKKMGGKARPAMLVLPPLCHRTFACLIKTISFFPITLKFFELRSRIMSVLDGPMLISWKPMVMGILYAAP
ncbi:hypothetical protein AJ88_11710 [Mesorhizobium amorphae CCBAU 01583]|nr:hypothetical protein AJ88_11710 [Mesorhizobium amorphae CCBAU 01583]